MTDYRTPLPDPTALFADCKTPRTRLSYTGRWSYFIDWCSSHDVAAAPATSTTVIRYLWARTDIDPTTGVPRRARSTVRGDYAAIIYAHRRMDRTSPDPTTGAPTIPIWADHRIQDALNEIDRQYPTDAEPEPSVRPLRADHLKHMIVTARTNAATWEERAMERRDTALILLPAMSGLTGRESVQLQIAEVHRARQQWWIRVDRMRSQTKQAPIAICHHTDVHLCAPCAWVRWLEVLDTHATRQRHGVIRLLARGHEQRWHVCKRRPAIHGLTVDSPCFPGGTTGRFRERHLTEYTATRAVRRRLAAAYPDIDQTGYGVRSLRAGYLADAIDAGHDIRQTAKNLGIASLNVDALHRFDHPHDTEDDHVHTR
ncbi:hypothetical protein Gbro_4713 [Gordonia bronchialis DSM 43247]|uniref:Uncharacterized protein n=1 Tax=Gordonia bronchialis (strain ATCC 25592 / DSM 43247 / BCRC 13721 / JCM 3198 / KCTC 3076 / NBRC 16047 / NCTC 10667) TaxID=526226 RepID=D0L886_GORB4|nr:hypothetical protein [Gordonia bronchialis]ACY23834.1 hypothetical protein Gbro_4713 [Gordonia bronchialis DSM 43247]MCC3321998.1 hypothetical protein [Gordonia bronchialis]QGS22860.1 hypothetical protein FOB84_00280 [Gordonia bronchialis]STQ66857.1 Uncharacterised protein [Gordonia bronchialis]